MAEFVRYTSVLGDITIAIENETLIGLWFDGQKYDRANVQGEFTQIISQTATKTIQWLDEYFQGKHPKMNLKLSPKGTKFQQDVWECLLAIPYGQTRTYSDIKETGLHEIRKSFPWQTKQIGTAIGHNPISIIIPCHRVIGKMVVYMDMLEG